MNEPELTRSPALPMPEYVASDNIKPPTAFTKAERVMSFAAIAFAFFFVHFALWNTAGFFTTALYLIITTAGISFMKKSGCNFSRINKIVAVTIYLFSFVFSVTANDFIKLLNIIFLVIAGAYFVYSVAADNKKIGRFFPFEILKSLFAFPLKHFSKECEAVSSSVKKTKFGPNAKLVIIGLVITIPLTIVVASLLMSADSGVEKILGQLGEFMMKQNVFTLIVEFVISIPAACWLFGLFYSNLHKEPADELNDEKCEQLLSRQRKINNVIIYTAITPICLLYLLFFVSQAQYFLSAFAGQLPDSYSYAEYARKGFFELFAIEIINGAVIFLISLFSKNCGKNKPKMLKFYTIIISVFTLVIVATAVSKMIMYINAYGLTQLRVYTTWFMLLSAFMFVLVIIKQLKQSLTLAPVAVTAFVIMFAALCFSRPDALIAKYNLETYSEIHSSVITEAELVELCSMSDDAAATVLSPEYSDTLTTALGERKSEFTNRIINRLKKNIYVKTNISAILILSRT